MPANPARCSHQHRFASGTALEYRIIRFSSHSDVVDRDASIWAAGDFLVKPVIDLDKAVGHHIFSFSRDSVSLVVSKAMRKALEAAGCTGVQFDAIAATSTG